MNASCVGLELPVTDGCYWVGADGMWDCLGDSMVLDVGTDVGMFEPVGTGAMVVSTDTSLNSAVSGIFLVVRSWV